MKKFLAFLLACSLCFVCFGTCCFAGVEEHDHHEHDACAEEHDHSEHINCGADVQLDEPVAQASESNYLYATLKGYTYSERDKTLTVTITIGARLATNLTSGTLSISAPYNTLLGKPTVSGYVFGQFISPNSTSNVEISGSYSVAYFSTPSTSTNNSPSGEITLTYPIDSRYLVYSWMRKIDLSLSGSAVTTDGQTITLDSLSRGITVYACAHTHTAVRVITAATCQQTGVSVRYCQECDYTVETIETMLTDHDVDFSKPYINSAIGQTYTAPTCTLTGYGYFKCKSCGTIVGKVIPAKGHTLGERYFENGSYRQRCTVCGTVVTAENQCSHDASLYVLKEVTTAPTCSTPGSGIYQCPTCGKTETRAIATTEHSFGVWTTIKNATCTAAGSRAHTCTVCNQTVTEEIAPLDHTYGVWTTITNATCISDGVRRRTCSVCGHADTQTIAKSGHNYGAWTVTKQPTCVETGINKRVCSLCHDEQTEIIPMTDHTYGAWMITVKPTCSAVGTEAHTCSVCGKSEQRSAAIDPNAHAWGEWKTVDAKTCITDGVKERKCSLCGAVDRATDRAAGHAFGEPVVKGKLTTKTCAVCGYVEQTKTVKGGVQKTLSGVSGSLFVSGSAAAKNVVFEIGGMPVETFEHYKQYEPNGMTFDRAYVFKLLVDGASASMSSDMKVTLSIDASLKDYDVKLVTLRGGSFYTLDDCSRKGQEITIDGSKLTGAEAIFVVKGEQHKTNVVLPIIIAVVTLAIAGVVVYFIMSKNKNKGNTF